MKKPVFIRETEPGRAPFRPYQVANSGYIRNQKKNQKLMSNDIITCLNKFFGFQQLSFFNLFGSYGIIKGFSFE